MFRVARPPRLRPRIRPTRSYASVSADPANLVTLVEVGPRDGLQNEKAAIPVDVKAELITRLAHAGAQVVEAGSFVSPKWVPQMAGTDSVLTSLPSLPPGTRLPVLVPNQKGLDSVFSLLDAHPHLRPAIEVSVFTAATDAFTRANLNCTVPESLQRLEPVIRSATDAGLRVRGYVSVVVACPYTGRVEAKRVRDVSETLASMGCYEISLGDTVGMGTPTTVGAMLEEVKKGVPVEKLAGHFHDTYGTAISNVLTALSHGIRTIDASVAGLGGCPYSPGATGNVATEDVLYALRDSPYHVAGTRSGGIDLHEMVEVGVWISEKLGRDVASRAGKAIQARRAWEESQKQKEGSKL
ncbi:Hydroxymethylglutaryl-lyase [Mycena chlorophos]|uniref:hydroxymethylglutaryl-CoA lyase n=1 Tax=Mycena chlorophos TaxID=658473 RepID=A0A8H6TEG1_MYCCL|nr:Hydroxymethylglutaryl-lyase [Mycena chlorophos]